MKKTLLLTALTLCAAPVFAADQCDYTPDKDKFSFGFTAYGFPNKSYDVKDNTFGIRQTARREHHHQNRLGKYPRRQAQLGQKRRMAGRYPQTARPQYRQWSFQGFCQR